MATEHLFIRQRDEMKGGEEEKPAAREPKERKLISELHGPSETPVVLRYEGVRTAWEEVADSKELGRPGRRWKIRQRRRRRRGGGDDEEYEKLRRRLRRETVRRGRRKGREGGR